MRLNARVLVFVLCATGIAVRTAEALTRHSMELVGDRLGLAWHCLPFVVIAAIASVPWRAGPWLAAALAVLAGDWIVMLMAVLVGRTRSGAGWVYLDVMFIPLYHLLFIAPASALACGLAGWWWRRRSRAAQAPPAVDGTFGA